MYFVIATVAKSFSKSGRGRGGIFQDCYLCSYIFIVAYWVINSRVCLLRPQL